VSFLSFDSYPLWLNTLIFLFSAGDCEPVLDQFAAAGVDVYELATRLQDEGAKSFVNSWTELMAVINRKPSEAYARRNVA
jgi:hypothetical protein